MKTKPGFGWAARWVAAGVGLAGGAYATYVGVTWYRYGHPPRPSVDEQDDLLDRFMPTYEVVERHHVRVEAPAAVTLAAAQEMDLLHSPLVRAIIKGRELILGATPDDRPRPSGLLAEVQSLGWGVLADVPGREIVVGGVTKPWEANPTFRAPPPDEFLAFSEPDSVKIVWTLRADPAGEAASIFRTETRVTTTDPVARAKFRRYWSFLSPGIIVIRWAALAPVKAEAERRAHARSHPGRPSAAVAHRERVSMTTSPEGPWPRLDQSDATRVPCMGELVQERPYRRFLLLPGRRP